MLRVVHAFQWEQSLIYFISCKGRAVTNDINCQNRVLVLVSECSISQNIILKAQFLTFEVSIRQGVPVGAAKMFQESECL